MTRFAKLMTLPARPRVLQGIILTGMAVAILGLGRLAAVVPSVQFSERGIIRPIDLKDISVRVSAEDGDSIRLGEIKRGVIFVFDPSCGPCAQNMHNWVDIIDRVNATHIALGIVPVDSAAQYWGRLNAAVTVAQTDTSIMLRGLRASGTPTTIVVKDGRAIRSIRGALSEVAVKSVVSTLSE